MSFPTTVAFYRDSFVAHSFFAHTLCCTHAFGTAAGLAEASFLSPILLCTRLPIKTGASELTSESAAQYGMSLHGRPLHMHLA